MFLQICGLHSVTVLLTALRLDWYQITVGDSLLGQILTQIIPGIKNTVGGMEIKKKYVCEQTTSSEPSNMLNCLESSLTLLYIKSRKSLCLEAFPSKNPRTF